MGIGDFVRMLENADHKALIGEAVKSVAKEGRERNIQQLYEGKTKLGTDISPFYVNKEYALYKKQLYPNSKRPLLVPNLILTKTFSTGIVYEQIDYNTLRVYSTDEKAETLEAKYKDIYGLTPENLHEISGKATFRFLQLLFKKKN